MDRKNVGGKRNERPNDVEEERSDKSGLKSDRTQGLKEDLQRQPEEEPEEYEEDDDDDDDEEDDEDDE